MYYVDKFSGSKRRKVQTIDVYHYVSLLETLRMLLENSKFYEAVFNSNTQSNPSHYYDFQDGSFTRSHPLLSATPKSFQVIAYYDELEICNPLGSSAKTHKLGCVFFTLGNIHPKFRSSYKSIFLSTIVKHSLVERHGMNQVLKPLVDDLNALSTEGIEVNRDG